MTRPFPKMIVMMSAFALMLYPFTADGTATEAGSVKFASRVVLDRWTLEIRGAGVLTYLGFIDAYAGAFYTLPDIDPGEVLADTPKRLEIIYFHALKGTEFADATTRGVRRRVSEAAFERLRKRLDHLSRLYLDVSPGDRYALTYTPDRGTVLSLNERALGSIPGADFAAAIFGLWLGDDPFDARFKAALLGGGK